MSRLPKKITVRWLRDHDACEEELDEFKAHFGSAAEIDLETLKKALMLKLNLYWFAEELGLEPGCDRPCVMCERRGLSSPYLTLKKAYNL